MMNEKYDFLIVGTGLFGAVSAYLLKKKGYSILMIDKRDHIGGNVYTENIRGFLTYIHLFGIGSQFIFDSCNTCDMQFVT